MRFDIRLLEPFYALALEAELGPAAARTGLTPAALLAQVQRLEAQLGTALIEQTEPRVILTLAGQRLAPEACRVLDHARAVAAAADPARAVRVAAVGGELGPTADELTRITAGVRPAMVEVSDLSSADQIRAVRAGELDLGFCHLGEMPHALRVRFLRFDPVVLACGPRADPDITARPLPVNRLRSGMSAWEGFLDALEADGHVRLTDLDAVRTPAEAMPRTALGLVPDDARLLTVASGAHYYADQGMIPRALTHVCPLWNWALVGPLRPGPVAAAAWDAVVAGLGDAEAPALFTAPPWLPPGDPFAGELERLLAEG